MAKASQGRKSARDKLREFFDDHVGEVVGKDVLQSVAGISEWARRVRELRGDEGMQIHTYVDCEDLKPGEYVLVSKKRLPRISHTIDAQTRARILERNGYTCQMCGRGPGDEDPLNPQRRVTLHIDHIDPDGPSDDSNLRVCCSACNAGRSNLLVSLPTIRILTQIRRASREQQREIYEWLRGKFEKE